MFLISQQSGKLIAARRNRAITRKGRLPQILVEWSEFELKQYRACHLPRKSGAALQSKPIRQIL